MVWLEAQRRDQLSRLKGAGTNEVVREQGAYRAMDRVVEKLSELVLQMDELYGGNPNGR